MDAGTVRTFTFRNVARPPPGVVPRAYAECGYATTFCNLEFLDEERGYRPATIVMPSREEALLRCRLLVTDAGNRPLAGLKVENVEAVIPPVICTGLRSEATTDEAGRAEVEMPRRAVRFLAWEPSTEEAIDLGVHDPPAAADAELHLVVPSYRMAHFRLRDEDGSDVAVDGLQPWDPKTSELFVASAFRPAVRTVHRRKNGGAVLVPLPAPEDWRLVVDVSGYARAEIPLWVGPDDPEQPHDITLRRSETCELTVRLVDSAGVDLDLDLCSVDIQIPLLDADAWVSGWASIPRSDVRCEFCGDSRVLRWRLPAGPVELTASKHGYADAVVRVQATAPSASCEVVLRRPASVRIRGPRAASGDRQLEAVLVEADTDLVRCVHVGPGLWFAEEVNPSRWQAAIVAYVWADSPRPFHWMTHSPGPDPDFLSLRTRVLLALSEPFDVAEGTSAEIALTAALGTLHLRCEGEAETVGYAITADDGRPLALDLRGRPLREFRRSASPISSMIPLPAGTYRISLTTDGIAPFATGFTIRENGHTAVVLPAMAASGR
jgi:hypothetical protein